MQGGPGPISWHIIGSSAEKPLCCRRTTTALSAEQLLDHACASRTGAGGEAGSLQGWRAWPALDGEAHGAGPAGPGPFASVGSGGMRHASESGGKASCDHVERATHTILYGRAMVQSLLVVNHCTQQTEQCKPLLRFLAGRESATKPAVAYGADLQ